MKVGTRMWQGLAIVTSLVATAGCGTTITPGGTGTGATGSGGAAASGSTATNTSSTGTGASTTAGSGSSSQAASTTSSSGTSSGMPDGGEMLTTYETGAGPYMLMPGQEETLCITIKMNNPAAAFVRRFRADLSEGSHHMIVYTSTATSESPTPTPCQPFAGILQGEHPVFIAESPQAELDFPIDTSGTPVGFGIAADQMVKIEFHMINTNPSTALMVTGKAYLDTIPSTAQVVLSDIAFWGTSQINIPPHSMADTGVIFQQAIPGTHSFAVTTHQHHLGTEMKVWYSNAAGDTSDMIADTTNWANPPLVVLDPPIAYPQGEAKGLSYECTWNNTTSSTVTFGESAATNEMCFLWHYYYPSSGFQACILPSPCL